MLSAPGPQKFVFSLAAFFLASRLRQNIGYQFEFGGYWPDRRLLQS